MCGNNYLFNAFIKFLDFIMVASIWMGFSIITSILLVQINDWSDRLIFRNCMKFQFYLPFSGVDRRWGIDLRHSV